MENLWHILQPEIPVLEKILRAAVIYFFVLVAFRFAGRREVGQLTPFDLVVLLIISNVVQNAIIGPDNSLTGGIIGALTILTLNYGVAQLSYRSPKIRHLLEPRPTILVHNGKVLHNNMRRELIDMENLHMALREEGLMSVDQVQFAILEDNGKISVIPKK